MSDTSRKWIGRAIQVALVVLAIAFVAQWLRSHTRRSREDMHVSGLATPPDSMGPGDVRIYNADSTLDLLLIGDKLSAGLSPKLVEEIRTKMDSSSATDSGLGGSIKSMITQNVASAIATHAEFALADLNDVRFEDGHIVFNWKTGSQHPMFENINTNGKRASDVFRQKDAERFIAAVHARQKELGLP